MGGYVPVVTPEEEEERRRHGAGPDYPPVAALPSYRPPSPTTGLGLDYPPVEAPVNPESLHAQRPQWKDYAPVQKHGIGRVGQVLGEMFLGTQSRAEDRAHEAYKNATAEYTAPLGEEHMRAQIGQEKAQTAEAEARAGSLRNPQPKVGQTPEDLTIHDLMAGDNGNPRVNPQTGKPYSYMEAYTAVNQAKQNVKPEAAAQEKQHFMDAISKVAAEGHLPTQALSDVNKLSAAIVASQTLTPDEKNKALAYLAANTTPAAQGTSQHIRIEGMQQAREYPVINKETGELEMRSATDINASKGKYAPAGEGAKAMSKTALIEDIRGNVQQVRDSLQTMTEFDTATKAKIAFALRSRDPRGSINALLTGGAIGTLDPKQQDYLINTALLVENAMAMRSVLGAGQGSEDLRSAITATIPGPTTPTKDYGLKQLEKFESVLNRLEKGIPGMPLKGGKGGTEKASEQAGGKTGEFNVPADAPKAPPEDGHKLKSNGKVIAISKGGQWVQPQ